MYDIFFLTNRSKEAQSFIKSRYPLARLCTLGDSPIKDAQRRSLTKMFWYVDPAVDILEDFNLNYKVEEPDQRCVHIFRQKDKGLYGGVYLIPKDYHITKKEEEFNFFVNKKNIDIDAFVFKSMDIFFISYDEPNAEENWKLLKDRFPAAQRIHGIIGIHQAHKAAASKSRTEMFWVVDGDAVIDENFSFEIPPIENFALFLRSVYVWQSINPINGLTYGYGGVKLLPKQLMMDVDVNTTDMTTAISTHFNPIPIVSNTTAFNTDPFNSWKSAFRECVKLSSKVIKNQNDEETEKRLDIWCSVGRNNRYGEYAILGALMGKEYGRQNANDSEALRKINDWEWLNDVFERII